MSNISETKTQLNVIELMEQGCPYQKYIDKKDVLKKAVENNHIMLIKYLIGDGHEWNPDICAKAAKYGHLEVLKYAHENGCPWDSDTCTDAAMNGHLEVFKISYRKY